MQATKKIVRVQRLLNIRIAKAYRTVSNEALCVITGLTPIDIKIGWNKLNGPSDIAGSEHTF
jgi:hypothetical protein